jgi:CheY-like chemotaxis protein/HPt (histidine-containing phosphotransfer) domain-containing protein
LLLAEDNEINQQVAMELLQQAGITVVLAKNGQEAVTLVEHEHFDAILMDLQMPVMDGLTATRYIRKKFNATILPIIAMTANAMSGDREKCLDAGMNDHVAKPVEPDELYATLAKWMTNQHGLGLPSTLLSPAGQGMRLMLAIAPMPGIDVSKGLRNVGGNVVLYRKILLKFVRNQGNSCRDMERCLASGERIKLADTAHAMKGVSATLGIIKLASLAGKLEQHAREGLDDLSALLHTTSLELARIVATIEMTLQQPGSPPAEEEQSDRDGSHDTLKLLFRKAVKLLFAFDSSVARVVEEIVPLALSGRRRKRLEAVQVALGAYDFDSCLSLIHVWSQEEGILLEE